MALGNAAPLLVTGGRLIDPGAGIDMISDLLVDDGKVSWVAPSGTRPPMPLPKGCRTLSANGLIVSPGFIDLHCHLREPGFEHKETVATGSLAAAKGGFTTVCAMPNTSPVMDNGEVVDYVLKRAREGAVVRVFPIGSISKAEQGKELSEIGELVDGGVVALSDDGMPVADSSLMRHAMEYGAHYGLMLIEHCEDPSLSHGASMNEGVLSARLGLKGMPAAAEEAMVARDIALAELTGARLHIAHVSTAGSVELIRAAKARGIRITAEVTPHHLTMTEDRVLGPGHGMIGIEHQQEGSSMALSYDTLAKVNPPLRTRKDVEALVAALKDGVIDIIATDHAPHSIEDKQCEFELASFGMSGLETALGALMSLVHNGHLELPDLIQKLTWGPAVLIGALQEDRRSAAGKNGRQHLSTLVPKGLGTLQAGSPADIVIFDPEKEWAVDPSDFLSKGKNTPLAGCTLKGRVIATVVAGEVVYEESGGGSRPSLLQSIVKEDNVN